MVPVVDMGLRLTKIQDLFKTFSANRQIQDFFKVWKRLLKIQDLFKTLRPACEPWSKLQHLLAMIKQQSLASESGRGLPKATMLPVVKSPNMDYAESDEVFL